MSQRVDKDSLPLDQPRRTPGHPTKSHIVKTKVDGKEKIIRFGEQGASTAGKPKAGESDRMKQKRASFKARHAKNIAKGKSSPAYWANKVKWAEGGEVKLARGGSAAMALLEQMRRSGNSPEFNAVEASLREQRMRPRRSVVPPPQQRQAVPQPQPQSQAEVLPLPPVPPAMRPDENPPPEAPRSARAFDEGNPFVATAIQMAERYNLPRDVFLSLVRQESNFNPAAVSPRGAIGLGQLMPGTARELGVDPNDPVQNLEGSARYLRRMLDRFGDMPLALAAYNAGPTRVALSGNTIPNIRETQNYVQTIMRNAGASGFAEGGLAELDSKYADGNVVTAYDPDAVEARIRSVAEPEGYAEGGRVGRVAGAIRRAARGKPEFFSLNEGPGGVPEVTRISPERMRELQALDDAMVAEANASRPPLNVRQQDVDRLAADLADNPMRAADEMAALREAEALRRAGATLADDLADSPFASRPEVMRVYHAGAEFDTPWPGLFTNPDRATVESFQQQMRAPRLHEFEISPRNIAGEEDIYDVARRYNVYMPDTPAAQYLEQGENAVFGEAADIVAELRRRGFDSARLNDGMGPEPSVVVLDPGIVRRYAEGGEISDEEYDRRLLSRMKEQTGRVTEPTRAEQIQALRTAGRSAAEGVADVLLPQSPLDAALMVALGPGGRAARLAGAGALAALEPSEAEASGLRRLAENLGEGVSNLFYRGVPRLHGRVSEVSGLHMRERGAAQPSNPYLKANTRDYAWASDNPAVASSYTHFGGTVIPLELVEPPGAVLNAEYQPWDRYFFNPGSRPVRGSAPDLTPEFREALEDPNVKSILVNNILDYGLESQKPSFLNWLSSRVYGRPYDSLNDFEQITLTRRGLTGNNLLIKDPSVVRYRYTSEPAEFSHGGIAELEQKYAEGGEVSVAQYDPGAVDALVKQIEAEYV